MLVNCTCPERPKGHDNVLVNVTKGVSGAAALGMIAVPCPDCGKPTEKEIVE